MASIKEDGNTPKRSRYACGPHGLGDPNDLFLRRVEIDVLIPKKMRDKARDEKCVDEVQKFTECCKSSSVLMVFSCREQNSRLKSCLTKWYEDEDFKAECKKEYLEERSEFRRTGVPQKHKRWASAS